MNKPRSAFYQEIQPWKQGALVLLVGLVIMSLVRLFTNNSGDDSWQSTWIVAGTFILFFAIVNSIFCLSATNQNHYFWQSLGVYTILVLTLLGFAILITGQRFGETESFKWMLVVISFCYLVIISIVRLIVQLINIAQKHENKLKNEK